VGIVGSSASPVSGMTIATLMATAAIFLVKGWTAPAFGALAITIGGMVCIAASNAGDTSQDLKTGYLIGATPWKQQLAVMIGVVISTLAIGTTMNLMNKGMESFQPMAQTRTISLAALPEGVQNEGAFTRSSIKLKLKASGASEPRVVGEVDDAQKFVLLNSIGSPVLEDGKYLYNPATGKIEVQWIQGIGSERAAAPQGRLMATVINGILSRKLPWGLVLLGVAMVIAVELLGIRSLSFAVGAYLPIGTTLPIFVGGVIRWLADQAAEKSGDETTEADSEISPGSLFASGLIAAGGIVGLVGVALEAVEATYYHNRQFLNFPHTFLDNDYVSVLAFAALAFALYYFARKPLKK